MNPDLVVYIGTQWAFLTLIGLRANNDCYWTLEQARASAPYAKTVAGLSGHPGYWLSYVAAIGASLAIVKYSAEWSVWQVVPMGFICATFICLGPLNSWAQATKAEDFAESLARKGLTSIPGIMFGLYLVFLATVGVLYFVFTHGAGSREVVITTVILAIVVALGTIVPHYRTFGTLRAYDVSLTIGIWILLAVAAAYRFYG